MEFVNKELAIKLKEKGFDKPCFGFYYIETPTGMNEGELVHNKCNTKGAIYKDCLYSSNYDYYFDAHLVNKVDAPTIEQVLKWLREEKKIYLNISYVPRVNNNKDFYYPNVQKIGDIEPIQFPNGAEDFDSYENAAIIGIEYVINKLI
jgi:hypothetical protein